VIGRSSAASGWPRIFAPALRLVLVFLATLLAAFLLGIVL